MEGGDNGWPEVNLASVRFPELQDFDFVDDGLGSNGSPSGSSPVSSLTADGDELAVGTFANSDNMTPFKRSIAALDGPTMAPTFIPTGRSSLDWTLLAPTSYRMPQFLHRGHGERNVNARIGADGTGATEGSIRSVNILSTPLTSSAAGESGLGKSADGKRAKSATGKKKGRGGRPRGRAGRLLDVEIDKTCPNMSEQEKKKLRRMISNRESARRSRRRKQAHVADLEEKVEELKRENARLTDYSMATTKKNKNLEERNRMLEEGIMGLKREIADIQFTSQREDIENLHANLDTFSGDLPVLESDTLDFNPLPWKGELWLHTKNE